MDEFRSVLLIMMLLAGSLSPPAAGAQGSQVIRQPPAEEDGPAFSLEPFLPQTLSSEAWIPFNLGPSLFQSGRDAVVTIRIYNSLGQVVAIPEAIDHPAGAGTPVANLAYSEPGRMRAYWDGKDLAGREMASGLYYIQLVVNNEVGGTNKIVLDNPSRPRRRLLPPW